MLDTIQGLKRTHYCGDLKAEDAGKEVIIMGWVQKRRDHGGLIFADLRDKTGLVQVTFNPEVDAGAHAKADAVRSEFVLAVVGEVVLRPEGTKNPNLATGDVEIYAKELRICNTAKTPPFHIDDKVEVDESIRLKYRYLDLRRPSMQRNLILRHKVAKIVRDYLDSKDFLEIETPMLTKSTPEGARDYLVPSRVHPGEFFALPQSPQIFKQTLMVAGMDKYFQITRCFRDEDLRADRQPEFTQIDIEMSFLDQEEILTMMEEMMAKVFAETLGVEVKLPFPRLTYREAMERFGNDKPDLRFGMELVDLSDLMANTGFKVFAQAVAKGGQVKAINAKGCAKFSRKEIDELPQVVAPYGAKGLAWISLSSEGIKSPIAKFFSEEEMQAILARLGAQEGDLLLFVADKPSVVAASLGYLRIDLAKRLDLIDPNEYNFLWVVDFPLLEYDEEAKRYIAIHHPFTSPVEEDIPLFETNPGKIRARAYDMVLNGTELGGGSLRIYQRHIQEKMFAALGFSEEEAREQFGHLLEAFEYGTPPHGGIAFGLDRLVMLLTGAETIRDVIAFPKTQSAACLFTDAPSLVSPKQLRELSIKTTVEPKKEA